MTVRHDSPCSNSTLSREWDGIRFFIRAGDETQPWEAARHLEAQNVSWDEKQERELEGDFAAGERTEPITLPRRSLRRSPTETSRGRAHGAPQARGCRAGRLRHGGGEAAWTRGARHVRRHRAGTREAESTGATPAQPIDVTATVVADEFGVQTTRALAVQGNYAVLVAQFADMDAAKARLRRVARRRGEARHRHPRRPVVNADYMGKVHIQTMTDHTTRNGFLWGAVAGVVVGLIFPPSILVDTAAVAIAEPPSARPATSSRRAPQPTI